MVTIKDIAERAGVTPTTVSRVVNNRGYVSEETRAKVTEAMKEMNYQPNALARALATKHTNTIGIIVPHINHPFFSELISSVEEVADARGYKILLCNSQEKLKKETEYMDMFASNKVSGILLCSKYIQVEKLKSLNIPIIWFEREEDNTEVISVSCDNYNGGRMAAKHLIDRGCKKLLFFAGRVGIDLPDDKRGKGFIDECELRGVSHAEVKSDSLAYEYQYYGECIREGLKNNQGIDGIFASGDVIAAKVIQECIAMGKKVPEDIKVVGFDDSVISDFTVPSITTIHQPIREMAEISIDYIIKKIDGKIVPSNTIMPIRLVKRQSS